MAKVVRRTTRKKATAKRTTKKRTSSLVTKIKRVLKSTLGMTSKKRKRS